MKYKHFKQALLFKVGSAIIFVMGLDLVCKLT